MTIFYYKISLLQIAESINFFVSFKCTGEMILIYERLGMMVQKVFMEFVPNIFQIYSND